MAKTAAAVLICVAEFVGETATLATLQTIPWCPKRGILQPVEWLFTQSARHKALMLIQLRKFSGQ